MADTSFAGWYQINEKEPSFNETDNAQENEPLKNIQRWGWMYKPFNEEESFEDSSFSDESEDYFRDSEKGKALEQVLWEEYKDVYDAIVFEYTQTGEYPEIISTIKNVVWEQWEELGLIFENKEDQKKLIDALVSAYIWENVDADEITPNIDFGYDVDIETMKESPQIPILNRFVDRGYLDKQDIASVAESLFVDVSLRDALNIIKVEPQRKEEMIHLIESVDDAEQNKINFQEDFPSNNWEKFDLKNDLVSEIIAENYVRIPYNWEGADKKLDLSTAIEVSANKILNNFPSIDRSVDSFKEAINKIHSTSSVDQYEWLKSLFNQSTAEKWKGTLTKNQNKRFAEQKVKKIEEAEKRFQDIKFLLDKARKNWNEKKIGQQKKEGEDLKQELIKDEVSEWEIIGGSKEIDVLAQLDSILKEETV
jgi:hypothetical protein